MNEPPAKNLALCGISCIGHAARKMKEFEDGAEISKVLASFCSNLSHPARKKGNVLCILRSTGKMGSELLECRSEYFMVVTLMLK